ncbi:hypothetical protein [Tumebacillus flagellatus]|uniref:Uncharacterized protein n=1 Tax=Tumebacillus flagellatus TaxID=1157490 RepID=A0A074LJW8_9BACL|nr:hypothetical protein [Tumebacillus flagellatus]KEO80910.1 hypothetical protein EL26_23675 [Tumebacillus flagellatus]
MKKMIAVLTGAAFIGVFFFGVTSSESSGNRTAIDVGTKPDSISHNSLTAYKVGGNSPGALLAIDVGPEPHLISKPAIK